METNKSAVEQQFSKNARDYRYEPLFSQGEDIGLMVGAVELLGTEMILDVGSGAGHTALAFAPFVKQSIGIDVTRAMVQVATDLAKDMNITNAKFLVGDAESIPFPAATFDYVTCRYCVHHLPQPEVVLREIARVLRPRGQFLFVDHYAPEHDELDDFINLLDRIRDPSHARENRLSEYKTWFLQSGLSYEEVKKWDLELDFENWVARSRTSEANRERLLDLLRHASPICKETFHIMHDEANQPKSFTLRCVLIRGCKVK